jgi:thiamine-phosphate diphosphorylase
VRPLSLMYVTDPSSCVLDVVDVARAAVEGGAGIVQARGAATDRQLHELACRLVDAVGGRARVVVNDRVDVALAAGAHGVHLKSDGLPIAEALALAEKAGVRGFLAGRSCHSPGEAVSAAREGAGWVTLGPVHAAHGRPGAGREAVERWLEEMSGPWPGEVFLLGGIGEADVAWVASLGRPGRPVGLAVVGALQGAGSTEEVVTRARRLCGEASS